MDFGRSRARLTSDKDKVKFDKVAGLTEEKEEVQELIDFLKDYRNGYVFGEGCPWCFLETKDLIHMKDHGPVLLRGKTTEQDLYVFTGSIIKNPFTKKYVIY